MLRTSAFSDMCEKCLYSKFFWFVFSRIRTEYGEIRSISVFSPNGGKYGQKNSKNEHFLRSGNL